MPVVARKALESRATASAAVVAGVTFGWCTLPIDKTVFKTVEGVANGPDFKAFVVLRDLSDCQ